LKKSFLTIPHPLRGTLFQSTTRLKEKERMKRAEMFSKKLFPLNQQFSHSLQAALEKTMEKGKREHLN
jgi:hypothetical protein